MRAWIEAALVLVLASALVPKGEDVLGYLSPEDSAIVARRIQRDPEWYVRNILGMRPWAKQIEILESIRDHKETAVASANGVGKSATAAMATHWFMSGGPGVVITTCVTQRQVRKAVWKEIRAQYYRAKRRGIVLGPEPLIEEYKISDGWYAIGFTATSADAFQSHHSETGRILVIVDEAAGVADEIFDEGVRAVLVGEHSRLLMLGNPTNPEGEFRKAFKDPDVNKIRISAFDTPNFTEFGITKEDIETGEWTKKVAGKMLPYPGLTDPAWVARNFRRWGRNWNDPRTLARILGVFPELTTDRLIPLFMAEAARLRTIEPSGPKVLGVDVARYGNDASEIVLRLGGRARSVFSAYGLNNVQLAGHVRRIADEIEADAIHVDVVGVGSGVVDILEAEGYPVRGINVGEDARDPTKFVNLRAELGWGLRGWFEDGLIDIDEDDEELLSQITDIGYKFDERLRIQLEPKADIKKRTGQSPDKFDALMLAFAPIEDDGPAIVVARG